MADKNPPRTTWERMAREDLTDNTDAMDRFYELSGKLQYGAGMPVEESDKTAFLKVVKNER